MKLEINLDLESALNKALSPEKMGPLLDAAVNAAIKCAIEEATGYRSEFRRALESQVKSVMPSGLDLGDVAKFSHVLNARIAAVVNAANNATIQAAMDKAVKAVIPDSPATIKLSELIKAAREGFHKEGHEDFYAHYRESEYGGGWLALDSDSDCRSEHLAAIYLSISSDGNVYGLRMDSVPVTPASMPNPVGRLDGLLLSMYVGRTSIEMDIDADEVESLARDQRPD